MPNITQHEIPKMSNEIMKNLKLRNKKYLKYVMKYLKFNRNSFVLSQKEKKM